MFNPRWITGKTIARVEMNPFSTELENHTISRPNKTAHNPRIFFEDGSSISFLTQETEVGEYGTEIIYRKAPRRTK